MNRFMAGDDKTQPGTQVHAVGNRKSKMRGENHEGRNPSKLLPGKSCM